MIRKLFRGLSLATLAGLAGFSAQDADAQLVWYEPFDFAGPDLTAPWVTHSGTGAVPVLADASDSGNSLAYAGLQASANNRISLSFGTLPDMNRVITPAITTGVVYYSFLIKMTADPTVAGSYILHLKDTGTSNFFARVFAQQDTAGSTFRLGMDNSGTAPGSGEFVSGLQLNQTHFVVVSYNVETAEASFWVNPPSGTFGTASAPTANDTDTGTVFVLDALAVRQASGVGTMQIDEIRVGQSWAAVTPAAPILDNPNIALLTTSLSFGQILTTTSATQTVQISNTGASNVLNIGVGTTISGAGAARYQIVTTLPLAINAGTTGALVVRFNPAGVSGNFPASLDIACNDASDPSVSVQLSGSSVPPSTGTVNYGAPTASTWLTAAQIDTLSGSNSNTASFWETVIDVVGNSVYLLTDPTGGTDPTIAGSGVFELNAATKAFVSTWVTDAALSTALDEATTPVDSDITEIKYNAANGRVYLIDREDTDGIVSVTSAGVVSAPIDPSLNIGDSSNLALTADTGYWLDFGFDEMLQFNVNTGTTSTFLTTPELLAGTGGTALGTLSGPVLSNGFLYFWDDGQFVGATEALYRANITTKAINQVVSPTAIGNARLNSFVVLNDGTVVAYDEDNDQLVVIETGGTVVRRTDIAVLGAQAGITAAGAFDQVLPGSLAILKDNSTDGVSILMPSSGTGAVIKIDFPVTVTVNAARTWELLD